MNVWRALLALLNPPPLEVIVSTLDTAHKVPVIVHTAAGAFVQANDQSWSFDPEGIAAQAGAVGIPDVGTCWYLAGIAEGETELTITGAGSSATVTVTVAAAPLSIEFGDPVPR